MGGTYPRADTGSNRFSPEGRGRRRANPATRPIYCSCSKPRSSWEAHLSGDLQIPSAAAVAPLRILPRLSTLPPSRPRPSDRACQKPRSPGEGANRPAAIVASQSRGPAVPEQAHLALAAPLWGPMYPTGNIQRVLGSSPIKEFIEF